MADAGSDDADGAVDVDLVDQHLRVVVRESRRLTCWRKLGH